jgi:hypothetical protein
MKILTLYESLLEIMTGKCKKNVGLLYIIRIKDEKISGSGFGISIPDPQP